MTIRSPRALIEQVSPERMEQLLRRVGSIGPFPDRDAKGYRTAAHMLVLGLGEGPRDDFEEVFNRVATFGDDRGRNAILIAANEDRAGFAAAMSQHQGPLDTALWCLLNYAEVFARAERVLAAECKRERPRDFIGSFMTDPAAAIRAVSLPMEAMERAFVGVYRERGDRCEAVVLFAEERPATTEQHAPLIQIEIQRKGPPEAEHVYEGEAPVIKRVIPVMPDTVVFHPETGLVEIISKHGDTHRERLAIAFCDAALGREPPVKVERIGVSFEALRYPRSFEPSPADGVRWVRLFELRTEVGKGGYETVRAPDGEDVYQFMRRRGTLHLLDGDIARVAFEVGFSDGNSNSKGRALKLVLADKDAISFPRWTAGRQAVGRRLLRIWGITSE